MSAFLLLCMFNRLKIRLSHKRRATVIPEVPQDTCIMIMYNIDKNFRDQKGNIEVYALIFSQGNIVKLTTIETEEDRNIIEAVLSEMLQKFRRARSYS